jgi:probable selenium-dependent hydroxylase accessory protein YqeC
VVERGMRLNRSFESLETILGVKAGSCVAIAGAGGKTTIMLALASALGRSELSVLVTTTTKIWPPEGVPLVLTNSRVRKNERLSPLHRGETLALGKSLSTDGKVLGVSPDEVDDLHRTHVADVILVEADGSAGRPIKAHRSGEPVVPASADLVLLVTGLDSVGFTVNQAHVHRVPQFCAVTGTVDGEMIRPVHVARALLAMRRLISGARRTVFILNKVDDAESMEIAIEIIGHLGAAGVNETICTSWGKPVTRPGLEVSVPHPCSA